MVKRLGARIQYRMKKIARERGQSFVEMAIVAPILIFILVGLFEVGWAIRGYLVLLSTDREATRYAARGDNLDFSGRYEYLISNPDPIEAQVGYDKVTNHTIDLLNANCFLAIIDEQYPQGEDHPCEDRMPLNADGTFIFSHYLIDTGRPCREGDTTCENTCDNANFTGWYIEDDLVLTPLMEGYAHFSFTVGITETANVPKIQSRLLTDQSTLDAFLEPLILDNNELNCRAIQRSESAKMSINSMIVVEAYYEQDQLLGMPLISNTVTDPVPLYVRTTMRIASDGNPTQGEGCELVPIGIDFSHVAGITSLPVTLADVSVTWLKWIDGGNSEDYFIEALTNKRLSINENSLSSYPDGVINLNDTALTFVGAVNTANIEAVFDTLVGRTLMMPVLDGTTISDFARFRLISFDLANSTISGDVVGLLNNAAIPPENNLVPACPR